MNNDTVRQNMGMGCGCGGGTLWAARRERIRVSHVEPICLILSCSKVPSQQNCIYIVVLLLRAAPLVKIITVLAITEVSSFSLLFK